jgi:DNA-binding MarR family transcriptional regulator
MSRERLYIASFTIHMQLDRYIGAVIWTSRIENTDRSRLATIAGIFVLKKDELKERISRLLPKNSLEMLSSIAHDGPATKYDVSKRLKMAYATANDNVKKLLSQHLIEKVSEKKFKAGVKKTYDLTLLGLALLLATEKLTVPLATQKYGDFLPLILRKWDYFKREGVHEMAERSLNAVCRFIVALQMSAVLPTSQKTLQQWTQELVDTITISTLLPERGLANVSFTKQERENWYRVVAGDNELFQMVTSYLTSAKESRMREVESLDASIKWLQAVRARARATNHN